MKKAKILWALMFIVLIIDSAFGQYSTDEKRADFYLDISKKYSPDSYVILKSDPDKRFVKYADNGETREALLDSYGTVVHETCHGYNFKIGFSTGWKNDGFYITDDIVIATMKGSYFPSSLLNQVVPREHQEKIFRYKTYVEGSSENSSTLEGIYGFLDEFSAYYHDTQANLQMRKFYETFCSYQDAPCWITKYLSKCQSTLYAYYEFRLFIAWYLMYAEAREKKVFDDFMGNKNLRVAFTLLDDLYAKTVDDYFRIREEVVKRLTESGHEIEIGNEYIFIVNGLSRSGTGIPDDDIQYLKSLFGIKENQMLEQFRIKVVTLSNYKDFLVPVKN